MPYISEELFQRLPRKSDNEPPSITVTPYPEAAEVNYRDLEVEAEVDYMQKIVSTVRSTRSDYNLPQKVKTDLFLRVFDDKLAASLKNYTDVIATLAYSGKVEVSADPPTAGCAIVTAGDKCSVHLVLSGIENYVCH